MIPRKNKEGKASADAGSCQGGKQHMRGEEVDDKRTKKKTQESPLCSTAVQKPRQRLNKALPHLSPGSAVSSGDSAGSGAATPRDGHPVSTACRAPVPSPRAKEPGEGQAEPALPWARAARKRLD